MSETHGVATENGAKPAELTINSIRSRLPKHLFVKSELRFLISVLHSLSLVMATAYLAYKYVPINAYWTPFWILFAVVEGTFAIGLWVLGHECGHGSFSDRKWANDLLGYILHVPMLVPFFSWQHSHGVHHSRNHHLTEDETHVPDVATSKAGRALLRLRNAIGEDAFAIKNCLTIFTVGWPAYLLMGSTGGPARGFTSHFFVPNKLFNTATLVFKVTLANLGLAGMIYLLYKWAQATSFAEVMALFIGPYLVTNFWLTLYTWLQHTEEDIPYYDETEWDWLKGSLATIDRNYHPFLNALHHHIGSTHIVHHLFSDLPHYNACEATIYVKEILKDKYRFDHGNVWKTMYRVAKFGPVEERKKGEFWFMTDKHYDVTKYEDKKTH
jgi:fatty acid desaturase